MKLTAALFLMITAHSLPAASGPRDPAAAPPHHPDAVHLPEGCYLSSLAYLAKFAAEFPAEQGTVHTAFLPAKPGHHTVALMTWRGEWWLRDAFLGVIRLRVPATVRADADNLARRVAVTLEQQVSRLTPNRRDRVARAGEDAERRIDAARAVADAARLLPGPSTVFLVAADGRNIPVLFFRHGSGSVALYDPEIGTGAAETDHPRDTAVVEALARSMGRRVTSVWIDPRRLVAAGRRSGGGAR
jgi:hypothetical protein